MSSVPQATVTESSPRPIRFAVIGSGYRARLFMGVARMVPDQLEVAAVVSRDPQAAPERIAPWDIPVVSTLEEMRAHEPELAVTAIPWAANLEWITSLVAAGIPVLSETPPAPDVDRMRSLWASVGTSGLVQVAEQYPRQPMNVARIEAVRRGLLGEVTSAHVSMTQYYHAVALLRAVLDVGFAEAEVRATAFTAPLVAPWGRSGWTHDVDPKPATTTIATLDFGGRSALYDFTDGQTRNPVRGTRFLVRGSHGELDDDVITRLTGPETVIRTPIVRRQYGQREDFEIADLDQIAVESDVLYRNRFPGSRMSDEEISIAAITLDMGLWCRGLGPEPYPLAEALQDHLLGLAIREAVATGGPVRVGSEPWAGREGEGRRREPVA